MLSRVGWLVLVTCGMWVAVGQTVQAEPRSPTSPTMIAPAKTVRVWQAQLNARADKQLAQTPIQVTQVRVESFADGIQVILETADGISLQGQTREEGNTTIIDVPNAVLALPDSQGFRADKPFSGITSVIVTQVDATNLRVSVTGENAPPLANVVPGQGLQLSVTPDLPEEEITVTGEPDRYQVPNSSVGTRTDTPIRDIPQAIQVVPQQVLKDQEAITLNDALRNVSGVLPSFASERSPVTAVTIRGFNVDNFLFNGLRDATFGTLGVGLTNVDRVEVLKGPASVLYGLGDLGGTINIVTKQPLRDPFYELQYTIGSFGFNRPAIDLSGPLNADRTVRYRLNSSVEFGDTATNFERINSRWFIAPAISWDLDSKTTFTLEANFFRNNTSGDAPALPAEGTVINNPNGKIPLDINLGEPDLTGQREQLARIAYRVEHRFNDNWSLRNEFVGAFFREFSNTTIFPLALLDDQRTLFRAFVDSNQDQDSYAVNTSLTGNFKTGTIAHKVLFGVELARENIAERFSAKLIDPIDIFEPIYSPNSVGDEILGQDVFSRTNSTGFYVQDQISLLDNLILVLGGRFDIAKVRTVDLLAETDDSQKDSAFSPRVGLVYKPIDAISLYASYARSFNPQAGQNANGDTFDPERGTQFEVGVKADLIKDRLSTTLAFYDLKRTNVLTADPDNALFQVQTGEQRSRGIEFDIQGEILPGWKIIANYAYTDAEISSDEVFTVGNQLFNVPKNSASLWTVYEIQRGNFKGFGIGVGVSFVGERQGDLDNSFQLPSYVRTDALVYYRRDRFRAQVNIRNLFGVDYFESSRSGNTLEIVAGAPLTVFGTVSVEF